MSLAAAYENDNIFAKIVAGDIPCAKIFETDDILAFMDAFPQTEGHCLVIHKRAKATNLIDIDEDSLTAVTLGVKRLAGAVRDALSPDGIRIAQFNGAAAGQTVFHLHFHVIPVYDGGVLRTHASGGAAPMAQLEETAAKIAAALS